MKIAVMGAGGVGAYVGARLQAEGEQVAYLARGAHLAAMQKDGLRIESPSGNVHLPQVVASDDPAQIGPVDLVLFTVKLWDTEAAARALAPLLAPHTRVVTLQNGIDSVAMISQHVPRGQVIGGSIYVSAVIARPGVITSVGTFHRIVVDVTGGDRVVADFVAACGRATGIECVATDAIDRAIWEKFVALSSISGATALLRSTAGPIVGNPEALEFLRQLVAEGVAVAKAAGHAVPDDYFDATLTKFKGLPAGFRASMAEDLERGKPLELKWLSGRMHALGLQHGVATPAHSAVYRALNLYAEGRPGST
jgi:2-dehydropantoate 2-reductase